MPGPHGKSKSKSKSKSKAGAKPSQPAAPDPFVGDVNNVEGWNLIVSLLCNHLELPDLTTRNGLKKIHRDFDAIYRRLDRLYEKNSSNEKIVGAVVGIYAKMCADSILRDKLFKAGFLARLLPLLNMDACRHLALRALSSVTHHGGSEARTAIALQTPALLKILEEHNDDPKVVELIIVTMSHTIGAVTGDSESGPNMPVMKRLDLPAIFKVFVDAACRPDASAYLINHVLSFFAGATLHYYKECRAYPSVLRFLVAALRSKDLTARCTSLGALIRLHHHEAEPDIRDYDPQKIIDAHKRGYPDELVDILMDYGFNRGDVVITLKTTNDMTNAYMKCAQDHDLYKLGLQIAQFIQRTEYSVTKGAYQSQNPRTGAIEFMDLGLPFKWWDDALPHCAKAIRAKHNPAEEDLADIIDIKYFITKGRIPDAISMAKRAIARNPNNAYFYYAITLGKDGTRGLKAAKQGLKCEKKTPFIRHALLQRAVDHAADMGIKLLQAAAVGGKKWEEGVAFLSSAMDDATSFVNEAPPDSRHMKKMLYWSIVLTLALNGSEIGTDLGELKDTLKKLKFADDLSNFVGGPPAKTELRLAQQTIISLYPSAVKEWGDVIIRFDNILTTKEPEISSEKVEDDLAAWLDDMHKEDGEPEILEEMLSHPVLSQDCVALYRCSYCSNPSAALRKCSGCAKTRYCDAGCQKSHWPDHKSKCTSSDNKV